jgi:TetR/AcrR family transcriptional repressor of nem operon
MKITRAQVTENRARILSAAARMFRERGFDAVTVAEVMNDAGLTHGAFYGHFKSKEDLIAQAFSHALAPTEDPDTNAPPPSLKDLATAYLSPGHRDNPGCGCAFAALGTEATRSSAESRAVLTEAIRRKIDELSLTAPGKSKAARRRVAIGTWSAMVGALVIARVTDDPALSDELLAETRAWLGV